MGYDRIGFCPTCHEEVTGTDCYVDKKTREKVDYHRRQSDPKGTEVAVKCPRGHVAEPIAETSTEECPVCHTVPRRDPFNGKGDVYMDAKLAALLKVKVAESGFRNNMVRVNRFDGSKYEFDPVTGKRFGDWGRRDRNKPCGDCIREIKRLREFAEEVTARQGKLEKRKVDAYPAFEDGPNVYVQDEKHELEHAWLDLMKVLGQPFAGELPYKEHNDLEWLPAHVPKYRQQRNNSAGVLQYTPEVIAKIDALYDAINKWGPAIAREAHDHGSNIIHALAEGRITGGEYDDNRLRYHPKPKEEEG
jgi:hypothetical protein